MGLVLALAFPIALAAQPAIESQPKSQTVLEGATVTFSVTAAGPSLSYLWIEPNSLLPGQTNSTLVLTNVTANNEGLYEVIVSNSVGAVTSSPAFLYVVTAPPSITVQPENQSVWGGAGVAFSVGVTGRTASLPPVRSGALQLWLKADAGIVTTNGAFVSQWQDQSGNANVAVQTDTNEQPLLVYPLGLGGRAALRFDGVLNSAGGDSLVGTGDVRVPNAMTAFTVYNAFSNVIGTTDWGAVIWFVGSPTGNESSRGCANFQGLLDFTTWDANYLTPFILPTNTYRICTDRVNSNLSSVEIFDNSAVSETNFSYAMAGESTPAAGYYVGALDPSLTGDGYSRCFDGDVAEIIIYQGYLSDTDRLGVLGYLEGKYFYSVGGGDAAYQWRLNGTNVAGATNATLVLANVQASNAGSYSISVANLAGSTISSNAVLTVNLIPNILDQPSNQTIFAYQSATFSVEAVGPTPLPYQWTFDGADIT
ncbi:MAG TPA: immunoglobulin domain-containing protein, partial [Verrucomicrobiae bacterium]|nr:immunoglobulin domain-containing protein [Verrucomicrobiae bacterium]